MTVHRMIVELKMKIFPQITTNGDANSQSSSTTSSPCKAKNNSQCANVSDEQQQVISNRIEKSTVNKSKNNDPSRNEIKDSQISEMNDLLILPLPNNRFKCPFCKEYNTSDRRSMMEHLYQEKNYERYNRNFRNFR